ncbi:hypothetical protein D3C72_1767860 [compost metagenome]
MQQQKIALITFLLQPLAEPRGVVDDDGAQGGIGDGGREPLMFEDLGQDFRGGRYRHPRHHLHEDFLHPPLVGAIHEGVHEADGDGRHIAALENTRDLAGLVLVERRDDPALRIDALGHHQPVAPRHIGRHHVLVSVPEVFLVGAADLDHVAEAAGADHGRARQAPRDQRIGGNGGAM